MAFSIGMQWCARFTRLLPDNSQRRLLVDYMRRLGSTAHEALVANLHDAGLDDERQPPALGDHHVDAPPAIEREAARPDPPDTMLLPDLRDREALVVLTAVAQAMLRVCTALSAIVRRLVLSHVLHGHIMDLGYVLHVLQVRRNPANHYHAEQRRWQELLKRTPGLVYIWPRPLLPPLELLSTPNVAHTLDSIRETFSTRRHTMSFVCGTNPGPRHAWFFV